MAQLGEVQEKIDAVDGWDLDRHLEIAMDAMRLPPGDMPARLLSGGERRRVALCKTLLQKPNLLLLDEPTNHLDAESVAWLERHLQEYPGTVVSVTHDRYFLDNVAQWILELDRGEGIPWKGNYSSWLDQKKTRLEKEEKQDEKIVYSERSYGMASRSFTLPGEVDAGGAKAEYKDGLLSLTLPKKANGGGKRVPVS